MGRPSTLKELAVISTVTLVVMLLLVLLTLALGADIFPFKSMGEPFEPNWHEVGTSEGGECPSGIRYVRIALSNTTKTEGWHIWYGYNDRLVGAHYTLTGQERTPTDRLVFAVIQGVAIVVRKEEPYNPQKHVGPCQWFDAVAA